MPLNNPIHSYGIAIGFGVVFSLYFLLAPIPAQAELSIPLLEREDEPPELISEQLGPEIYRHEKMYVIAGGDSVDFDAKFQLSLKVRVGGDIFASYSQTSVWDLGKLSKPFHDSSYRPALFYYKPQQWSSTAGPIGLATGVEHESNGKAGIDSRSMWIVFAKPYISIGPKDDYHWAISPKIYGYLRKEDNNGDIADYRGYADLIASYRNDKAWEFGGTARFGRDFGKGSLQLDVSQKVGNWIKGFPGYFYLQLFSGYGETLLDYNIRRNDQIRLGFMIARDR